jgi:hypothetical protein
MGAHRVVELKPGVARVGRGPILRIGEKQKPTTTYRTY